MDVDELLQSAWTAVEKAGIPEESRETGFKEAAAFLRASPNLASELPKKPEAAQTARRGAPTDTVATQDTR